MTFLLDTNFCIQYLNRRDSVAKARMASVPPADIRFCAVVKAELFVGAYRSPYREKNLGLLRTFFSQFDSVPFDDGVAEVYGRMRAPLSSQGILIGPNDLMIGAIALANNLILLTHNMREFSRIDRLRLEDWEVPAA